MTLIFKVCDAGEWDAAVSRGSYAGSAHDQRDGFIHFSTAAQLPGTLARHYAGRDNLVLIAFEAEMLGPLLKWEPARDGELFPHLYAELSISTALRTRPLRLGADGVHIIPEAAA
jgi:uncharacterized protein (DUF952 family)